MDKYTATEIAYKNGYEQGKKDAIKQGKWLKHDKDNDRLFYCSICNSRRPYSIENHFVSYWNCNYCPTCGAKMICSE